MADVSPKFDVGYSLTLPQMHQLDLYISGTHNGVDVESPFAEPGLFVINEDSTLQLIDISNVPFSRPNLNMNVKGISFLRAHHGSFPINGTHI